MKTRKIAMFVALLLLPLSLVGCDRETILPESDVPTAIKNYVAQHFDGDPILQSIKDVDGLELTYDIMLKSMTKLEFNRKYEIIKIEAPLGGSLPNSVIPTSIREYVEKNYSTARITEWAWDTKGTKKYQEVELNDGTIDLIFDANGIFYRIGD
ncbi:MAG: PepSY-like domain-containing protein [Paludibacteraceae bacterium]|nr:PepSY-like domain-containing protein [Paludibacteraceae bacterium]